MFTSDDTKPCPYQKIPLYTFPDYFTLPDRKYSSFLGARDKQKYQLLPWLVFIFMKALVFLSIGISLTSQNLGEKHVTTKATCHKCLGQAEKQHLIIGYIFTISGKGAEQHFQLPKLALTYLISCLLLALHLYFWVVVYSLYAKLSARHDVMSVTYIWSKDIIYIFTNKPDIQKSIFGAFFSGEL